MKSIGIGVLLFILFSPEIATTQAVLGSLQITEILDLPYYAGDDAVPGKHKLDLYLPDSVTNPPLLMWIHGGAWAFGGRSQEAALARQLTKRGVAVAAISHRLSPAVWRDSTRTEGVQHPAHVIDCARAFAWLHRHAGKYGYDSERMFVSGYSSGAHLSALLAMDGRYLAKHDLGLQDIRGAIPIAGAYDLEDYYRDHIEGNGKEFADAHVLGVFGYEANLGTASPASYLEDTVVPMLVVSEADTYEYTRLFERQVQETGIVGIHFLHDRDRNHAELYKALTHADPCETRERIVHFIDSVSQPTGPQ